MYITDLEEGCRMAESIKTSTEDPSSKKFKYKTSV